eukprot:gb/GEZJ01005295.1/.p1 GENE.gb/GEZJ01005295.1/~~gb/GEZJ01005295.1/.p1  ORF type:complete len:102 (+),score=4.09 gb/GEZJ01005295.1/:113-418(+)
MAIIILANANSMLCNQVVAMVRFELDHRRTRDQIQTSGTVPSNIEEPKPRLGARKAGRKRNLRKKLGVRCWSCAPKPLSLVKAKGLLYEYRVKELRQSRHW